MKLLLITSIGATLLTSFQLARRPRTDADGNPVLMLPGFYGVLGTLAIVGGIALLLHLGSKPDTANGPGGVPGLVLFTLALFIGPGGYLMLNAYLHRVTLTTTGLLHRSVLGRLVFLPWTQIQGVRFNTLSLQLIIGDGRHQVRCHAHLLGFDVLVQQLTQYTGRTSDDMDIC